LCFGSLVSDIVAVVAQLNTKIDSLACELKPMKKALDIVLSDMYDPWASIKEDSSSVGGVSMPKQLEICEFYEMVTTHCMILGKLPAQKQVCNIVNAHIWPKHTNGRGLDVFNLEAADLNHVRNFLRLQSELEKAFDMKKLILLPDFDVTPENVIEADSIRLRVKILDLSLKGTKLTLQNHSGSKTFTINWNDIDGKLINKVFKKSKPFLRLLAQHAHISLGKASANGWIDEEGLTESRRQAYLLSRKSLGVTELNLEALRK
jgi:hypothetical protein